MREEKEKAGGRRAKEEKSGVSGDFRLCVFTSGCSVCNDSPLIGTSCGTYS